MKYDFYIIGAEELEAKGLTIWGLAYTEKSLVQWEYDWDLYRVQIHSGLTASSFNTQLKAFIDPILSDIKAGKYPYNEERKKEATKLLASKMSTGRN